MNDYSNLKKIITVDYMGLDEHQNLIKIDKDCYKFISVQINIFKIFLIWNENV